MGGKDGKNTIKIPQKIETPGCLVLLSVGHHKWAIKCLLRWSVLVVIPRIRIFNYLAIHTNIESGICSLICLHHLCAQFTQFSEMKTHFISSGAVFATHDYQESLRHKRR